MNENIVNGVEGQGKEGECVEFTVSGLFFKAEDGIQDEERVRGLGDVDKGQGHES